MRECMQYYSPFIVIVATLLINAFNIISLHDIIIQDNYCMKVTKNNQFICNKYWFKL